MRPVGAVKLPVMVRSVLAIGVGALCGACGTSPSEAAGPDAAKPVVFVDVAEAAGIDCEVVCGDPRRWYIPESNGSGAAWLDADKDGDLDLFLGNGARLRYHDDGARLEVVEAGGSRYYRNEGDLQFVDATDDSGLATDAWINAVTVGDADGDGDPDLYLACFGDDLYLRNDGGTFVDATEAAGLGNSLWGAGAAFGDIDNDGDLDLYVANYCLFDLDAPPDGGKRAVYEGVEIGWGPEEENGQGFNLGAPDRFYLNEGAGVFREATKEAGFALEKDLCSYAVVFTDVDQDGWQDVLVANDLQPCNLFHNRGDGRFDEEGVERGFALNADGQATAAMGLLVADVDEDGDMDVLRTNFDFEPNSLHVNDGEGRFTDRAAAFGLAEPSVDRLGWGGAFFDADRDGDLELLVANGHVLPQAEAIGMNGWAQASQLFDNAPGKTGRRFREVEVAGGGLDALRSARGVALADPDQDGDLDALIVDIDARPRLLENRTPPRGAYLRVRTHGTHSNSDGLGARVRVVTQGRAWVREIRRTDGLYSSHDPAAFFGLGDATSVERVEVHWPSGLVQVVEKPELNTTLVNHRRRRSMKTLLIFPPQGHFTQPYLSLPSLVAWLNQNGYEDVTQLDLNIEAYDYFLSRERLTRSLERVQGA